MDNEDDMSIEIDFVEKTLTFICKKCRHINVLDFSSWQRKQKHSPLPQIRTM